MGNQLALSQDLKGDQLWQQYQQIGKERGGAVVISKKSNERFFLKVENFSNKQDFEQVLANLVKERKNTKKQSSINIVKIWTKQFVNICSNHFQIYSVYDYPQITLKDEIQSRIKESKYFQESDLWSIAETIISCLLEMNLSVRITTSDVFIKSDGLIKLIHQNLADFQYRKRLDETVYYPPEKIIYFNNGDENNSIEKQAVFTIGMNLLQCSLLRPLSDCYNYKTYKFISENLQNYLKLLTERYSCDFVSFLVSTLNPNPTKRSTLIELQNIILSIRSKDTSFSNNQKIIQKQQKVQVNKESSKNKQNEKLIQNKQCSWLKKSQSLRQQLKMQDNKSYESTLKSISINNHLQQSKKLFLEHDVLSIFHKRQNHNLLNDSFQKTQPFNSNQKSIKILSQQKINIQKSIPNKLKLQQQKKPIKRGIFTVEQCGGLRYEGMLVNGIKEGFGKLTYSNGCYYEGMFKNNTIQGRGALYMSNGQLTYSGDWRNGKFNGNGTLYNNFCEEGVEVYELNMMKIGSNWDKYEGQFQNSLRHGRGILYLKNGDKYIGKFVKDRAEGKGQYLNIFGENVIGTWKNNSLVS